MSINEQGAERRLAVVHDIISQFGLQPKTITPLAFDAQYAYPFNNFIFKVDLVLPALAQSFPGTQPGTAAAAPADGLDTVVVRLSNLRADGLNQTNRVQNDVACSLLARQAVQRAGLEPVVPAVFAWAPPKSLDLENMDEANLGWVVTEYKPGADLDRQFPTLSAEDKESVLSQLAGIVAAVQQAEIPPLARQFGGLAFDGQGNIVSAQMAIMHAGPFKTYADIWTYKLQAQLRDSSKSPVLQGWKENGLDKRIQAFLDSGNVSKVLANADPLKCSLVHCDLTMNNLLYDSTTKHITALLDFDFSGVNHPAEEFSISSLGDIGGGLSDDPKGILACILSNNFSAQPQDLSEEDAGKWETAKTWHRLATEKGVVVPGAIPGIDDIQRLKGLHHALCPFQLSHEMPLKNSSDESKAKKKKEVTETVVKFLEEMGF